MDGFSLFFVRLGERVSAPATWRVHDIENLLNVRGEVIFLLVTHMLPRVIWGDRSPYCPDDVTNFVPLLVNIYVWSSTCSTMSSRPVCGSAWKLMVAGVFSWPSPIKVGAE